MQTVVVQQAIAAPPERVYALATDLAGAPERIAGIDAIEVLTDGPFGVGTRWRETRTLMGRTATEVMKVTRCEPGRGYTTVAPPPGSPPRGCRYVSSLALRPQGTGTLAEFRLSGEATSLGSRLVMLAMAPLAWLMARQVRKCLAEDLADLKRAAEAGE